MDLNVLGDKVKKLFEDGKTDEDIAAELKITTVSVASIRNLLDLHKKLFWDAFTKPRRVGFDDYNQQWFISMKLPHDISDKLKMSKNNKYNYFATCDGKQILIKIEEKDE